MKGYSEGRLTVLLTKKALKIKVFGEIVADTPAKALVLLDGNAWDFYNRIAFRKSGRGVFRRSFRRRADAAYVETYRSGHNGAHSKCVSRGNRLEGSNPSVSARWKNPESLKLQAFGIFLFFSVVPLKVPILTTVLTTFISFDLDLPVLGYGILSHKQISTCIC